MALTIKLDLFSLHVFKDVSMRMHRGIVDASWLGLSVLICILRLACSDIGSL